MSREVAVALVQSWVLWSLVGHQGKAGDSGMPLTFALKEKKIHQVYLYFATSKQVEIKVRSMTTNNSTDIDLFVLDEKNNIVAKDEAISKDCNVQFTPAKSQFFRIVAANLGPGDGKCTLTYTGADVKLNTSDLKPVELKENEEVRYQITFEAGKPAAVWVEGEKESDIDLIVYDSQGKRTTGDERVGNNCFAGFSPASTALYRVEIVNLGPGDNRCKIKHTGQVKK